MKSNSHTTFLPRTFVQCFVFILFLVTITLSVGTAYAQNGLTGQDFKNALGRVESIPPGETRPTGCDPTVEEAIAAAANDAAQRAAAKWDMAHKSQGTTPSVLSLTCFSTSAKEVWDYAKKIWDNGIPTSLGDLWGKLKEIGEDVLNDQLDNLQDEIENFDVGKFLCDKAVAFINKQKQCFNWPSMFQLDIPDWDFDFDQCLIRADFSLNRNGFSYSISSDLLNINESDRWGIKSGLLLGEEGVERLLSGNFDDGSGGAWDPAEVERSDGFEVDFCKGLDPAFDPDRVYTLLDAFNIPEIEVDYNGGILQFGWNVSPGCYNQENEVVCNTDQRCYNLPINTSPPPGTCFASNDDGTLVIQNGYPVVVAPVRAGEPFEDGEEPRIDCGSPYVVCDDQRAFDECGIDINKSCCNPSIQECNESILDICLCTFVEEKPGLPALNTDMWTERDASNNWTCTGDGDEVAADDLVPNCCDPELNDCEAPEFAGMEQCIDPAKLCYDPTTSQFSGDGENSLATQMPLLTQDLFSIYDYLVIKPDKIMTGYLPDDNGFASAVPPKGQPNACCSTQWCNICPHNVLAAYQLRAMNVWPGQIGVHENQFLNSQFAIRPTSLPQNQYGIFSPTGNIYMVGPRPRMAFPKEVPAPNENFCIQGDELPPYILESSQVLECAILKGQSIRWTSAKDLLEFWGCVADHGIRMALREYLDPSTSTQCSFSSSSSMSESSCKNVPELDSETFAFHPKILEEGYPIGNINYPPNYTGETLKQCSEFQTCKVEEGEYGQGGSGTTPIEESIQDLLNSPNAQEALACANICNTGNFMNNSSCLRWNSAGKVKGGCSAALFCRENPCGFGEGCHNIDAEIVACTYDSMVAIGAQLPRSECLEMCGASALGFHGVVCHSCLQEHGCGAVCHGGQANPGECQQCLDAIAQEIGENAPNQQVDNVPEEEPPSTISDEVSGRLPEEIRRRLNLPIPVVEQPGGSDGGTGDTGDSGGSDGGSDEITLPVVEDQQLRQPVAPETPSWQRNGQQQQQRRAPSLPTTRQPSDDNKDDDSGGGLLRRLF